MLQQLILQQAQQLFALLSQDMAEIVSDKAGDVGEFANAHTQGAQEAARLIGKNVRDAVGGSLGLTGERMSKVDTAWLRMDTPENLMLIVGVLVLKPSISLEALKQRVEEKLLEFSRFTQRVVEDAAGATWVNDRKFDLDKHVVEMSLNASDKKNESDQSRLSQQVAALALKPLVSNRPLWQMHMVRDYTLPDGSKGSALVVRIHHCIADGIALIQVMLSLLDGGAMPAKAKKSKESANALEGLTQNFLMPLLDASVKAFGAASTRASRSTQSLSEPQQGLAAGGDMARIGAQLLADLSAMALMPDDSPTRLKGKPGRSKKLAWCEPIPLDHVKAVGKALDCSVNDVLLASVAGAIGQYLRDHGDDTQGQQIRAMVPVNLRPLSEAHKLGNRFGLAPLVLPIGIENPVERVLEVKRRMRALKGSYQPLLAFSLLAAAGMLLKPAQDALLKLFSRKTTAVMTNVPGPKEKHQFLGSSLEELMFWVPQTGDVGVGVSILSYGGGVQFGLITDEGLCPNPQAIIDEFAPEFAKLATITLMLPWAGEVSAS